MLVKVNSTRDTAVGLFRAGMVYDVQGIQAQRAVKPHIEKGGPFVELKGKDAKEALAEAVKVIGPADAEAQAEADAEDAAEDGAAPEGETGAENEAGKK